MELYDDFLNKLSHSAASADKEMVQGIVDLKSKLSEPHKWLVDKVKKTPDVINEENNFIKSALQVREYERLAKGIKEIKIMIDELAASIKDDDKVPNSHMIKLSDMLRKLDKAKKSMQLYDRQMHRFEKEDHDSRSARTVILMGAKFDLEKGLVSGELSKMETERELMIKALMASGKTSEDIARFKAVHAKMDKIGNRIMLAAHRLSNIISSTLSAIFKRKNKKVEPEQSLSEKFDACKYELAKGKESSHDHTYDSSVTHVHDRSAPATRLADEVDGVHHSAPAARRAATPDPLKAGSSPAEVIGRRNPSRGG